MKQILLILFLQLGALACLAQTLFFEHLNNSVWTSRPGVNDASIRGAQKLGLAKMNYPKDSISENAAIWTFREGILTIHTFNGKNKKDSLVAAWSYAIDTLGGKLHLTIELKDKAQCRYDAGIISTGNYVVLLRSRKISNTSRKR